MAKKKKSLLYEKQLTCLPTDQLYAQHPSKIEKIFKTHFKTQIANKNKNTPP